MKVVIGIIIVGILWVLLVAKGLRKRKSTPQTTTMKEIQDSDSIKDIIMSVNLGGIRPYKTGMGYEQAKGIALKLIADPTTFENNMQLQELMGITPYIHIDIDNKYIERISVNFNKDRVVSAIGIDIKDFHINMKPLVEEMTAKFGKPTSMDNEFIIWRSEWRVINIHKEGSLSVIDERLWAR